MKAFSAGVVQISLWHFLTFWVQNGIECQRLLLRYNISSQVKKDEIKKCCLSYSISVVMTLATIAIKFLLKQ